MATRKRLTQSHNLVKDLNHIDEILNAKGINISWGEGGNCLVFSQGDTHAVHVSDGEATISLPITYDGSFIKSDEFGNILDYEEE